ncbi:MAG: hypothetical protein ACR2GN_02325 [Bacteroidia bacterium]
MFGVPEGKGIMAFSDTAGGNACLSLAFMLEKEGCPMPALYTNNSNFINNDWNCPVNFVNDIEEVPEILKGDFLFTGTSHPGSSGGFELQFIQSAKRLQILSISFIDHWVNFKIRFMKDAEIIYPDEIWILDEKAREAAVIEGIPIEKLTIHENPQHLYLRKYWRPKFSSKDYLHQLGIVTKPDTKIILFAPDPVSLRYKENELAFDEASALKLIVQILSETASRFVQAILIIKPHPLQPEGKLEDVPESMQLVNIKCLIIKKAQNLELIHSADIVVGFYSNFLLEALQLNKKVLRYFPGPASLDPFEHLKEILPPLDEKELYISLKNEFSNE